MKVINKHDATITSGLVSIVSTWNSCHECELIWEKGLCRSDKVKDLRMRCSWIVKWVLNPMTSVLLRDKKRGEEKTHRAESVKTEAEIGVMKPQDKETKNCQQPPEARREAWDPSSFSIPRGNQSC